MTRDEAIKILSTRDNQGMPITWQNGFVEAYDLAIEALERKKGKWNETSESIGWEEVGCAECSVCGETFVLGDYTMDDIKLGFNYCPNCGARMKGAEDDKG